MARFLLVYFGVYGGLHLYMFVKLVLGVSKRAAFVAPVAAWLLLMILAPIITYRLDRAGRFGTAGLMAITGFTWMAVLFWFFSISIVGDVWNLTVRAASLIRPGAARLALPRGPMLAATGLIILVLSVWGLVGAWRIRVVEVDIASARLPEGSDPIRIVQISDVHLGLIVGERRLRRIVSVVEGARPDVLVSTGDLVDASDHGLGDVYELLAAIKAPLGKFAVLGNHEFYAGLDGSLAFHEAAGFRVLRQESVLVGGRLRIAGVDDDSARHVGVEPSADESKALEGAGEGEAVVLLKHRPTVSGDLAGRFDLQLSGHTHGGQIFPFTLIVDRASRYSRGLHDLGKGSSLYVSLGTGTWGPPMRVLAPAEVTVITLRPL